MNRVVRLCLSAFIVGLVAGVAAPVSASPMVQIVPCVEHHRLTPAETNGTPIAGNDAQHLSQVGVAVGTDLPPGTPIMEQLQGGGRNLSLTGAVAADRTFFGRFGISQFADYAITVSAASDTAHTTFTVGPQEHLCAEAIATAQRIAAQTPGTTATTATPASTASTTGNPPATTATTSTWHPLWLVPIGIGILLALFGLMIWRPLATREKPPPVVPLEIPHTQERPPVTPDGEIPLTGGPPPTTVVRPACDWALYFDQGGALLCLRKATAHECCRYIISVESSLRGDFQTKGRQGPDHLGDWSKASGERTRIPDLGARWDGLESWSWAGARSGPAGTLNWMQGYGDLPHGLAPPGPATLPAGGAVADPVAAAPGTEGALTLAGQSPYHQPPDVLAQMAFLESTLVKVRLENHCKRHSNTYSGVAESNVDVYATDECTNSAGDPCPVKLTAAGWVGARVTGDLSYSALRTVRKLADQDHAEWLQEGPHVPAESGDPEPLPSFGGTVAESHDHRNPPRRVYQSKIFGRNARDVFQDNYRVRLSDYAELYAGVVVPVEVWSTTDRVTAAIWSHVRHAFKVAGTDNVICDGTCCGPNGTCKCAPAFELFLGPGKGLIRVDGNEYPLERPHGQRPDGSDDTWWVEA